MGYFLPPLRGEIKAQVVSGHQLRAPKHPALRGEIKAQVVSGWNSLPAEMLDAAVAPHTEDGFSVTGAVIVARVSSCARHPIIKTFLVVFAIGVNVIEYRSRWDKTIHGRGRSRGATAEQ